MAPLSVRLAAGAFAPVTADEVRELLGWSRERTDTLLARVPRIRADDGKGRVLWRWGRVLDVAEAESAPKAEPAPPLVLADVQPRRPRGRASR